MTRDARDSKTSGAWRRQLEEHTATDVSSIVFGGRETVVGLTILAHPDPRRVGEFALMSGLSLPMGCQISRLEPLFKNPEGHQRPLAISYLSRRGIRVQRVGDLLHVDLSGTSISLWVDGRLQQGDFELDRNQIERGVVLLLANRIALLLHECPVVQSAAKAPAGIVGGNFGMLDLFEEIQRLGPLDVSVLIRGETGTGKELVAKALHEASNRRSRPFLAVNMAALPPTLAAAELFGATAGAYTGAQKARLGLLRKAHGGTLFLDEIGAAGLDIQALLLRFLEDRIVRSVGAESGESVDVRILAATDSDLELLVEEGEFREPLLQRLSAYEVRLPPLRERVDDVGRLFYLFLRQELEKLGAEQRLYEIDDRQKAWLPAVLMAEMALLDWKGNVRQLRNLATRLAVRYHDKNQVDAADVLSWLDRPSGRPLVADSTEMPRWESDEMPQMRADDPAALEQPPEAPKKQSEKAVYRDPSEVGEEELIAALDANDWKISPTAKTLGVSRGSLYALIDRCEKIRKAADLDREEIERCHAECGGVFDQTARRLKVSKDGLKLRMKELGLL